MTPLTDEAEPTIERICALIDTLTEADKRAAHVRLLAIAALNAGDLNYIGDAAHEAVETVRRFLQEKATVLAQQAGQAISRRQY
jgi:hypothetical protein